MYAPPGTDACNECSSLKKRRLIPAGAFLSLYWLSDVPGTSSACYRSPHSIIWFAVGKSRQVVQERTMSAPLSSTPAAVSRLADGQGGDAGRPSALSVAAAARTLALQNADVVFLMGARFNWIFHFGQPSRYAKDMKVIQITSRPRKDRHKGDRVTIATKFRLSQLHRVANFGSTGCPVWILGQRKMVLPAGWSSKNSPSRVTFMLFGVGGTAETLGATLGPWAEGPRRHPTANVMSPSRPKPGGRNDYAAQGNCAARGTPGEAAGISSMIRCIERSSNTP